MKSIFVAAVTLMAICSCRLSKAFEVASLSAMMGSEENPSHSARITFRGEVSVDLSGGMSPAEALKGANAQRVRQLVDWQLQYVYGAVRHAGLPDALGPVSPSGRQNVHLLGVTVGAKPTTAVVSYEYTDVLVAPAEFESTELKLSLPRDVSSVFAKTLVSGAAGGTGSSCADGAAVAEDHLWFFWNPASATCHLSPDDVTIVRANIEPIVEPGPKAPDFSALIEGKRAIDKLSIVYLIGDDRGNPNAGASAFAEALELLGDAGFKVRAQRPDRRATLMATRANSGSASTAVTLEIKLVDPSSFEFVKASAAAMETADVFIYNGQTGFGNYLDWSRYTRILGRQPELPPKSQIFAFNGPSPFLFESSRFFAAKATTLDPEGFLLLDVLTTTPAVKPVEGGLVGADVALLASLVGDARPTWNQVVSRVRGLTGHANVVTYVTGGR